VKQSVMCFLVVRLAVLLVALPLLAGAGEPPAKVTSLVGTLTHVTPASRTVVVEVPLEDQVITVGAWAVPATTLTAGGRPVEFQSLKEGSKVRIRFRRVPDGDELLSLEVLRAPGA
jgi:hypothetical protein